MPVKAVLWEDKTSLGFHLAFFFFLSSLSQYKIKEWNDGFSPVRQRWVEGVLNIPTHDRECLWEGRKCTDHHDAYWTGAGVARRGCDKHFYQPKDKAASKSACGLLAPKPLSVSPFYQVCTFMGLVPGGLVVENCQCRRCGFNACDGEDPGEGSGFPFQYSFCLGNYMDRGGGRLQSMRLQKSQTRLSGLTTIAASQTCVSFCCTAEWVSHKHTLSLPLWTVSLCDAVCSH